MRGKYPIKSWSHYKESTPCRKANWAGEICGSVALTLAVFGPRPGQLGSGSRRAAQDLASALRFMSLAALVPVFRVAALGDHLVVMAFVLLRGRGGLGGPRPWEQRALFAHAPMRKGRAPARPEVWLWETPQFLPGQSVGPVQTARRWQRFESCLTSRAFLRDSLPLIR